jgi:MbtH protein
MGVDGQEDVRDYNVVVNHEEQYSIWFKDREVPMGWSVVEIPDNWWQDYSASHADARNRNAKQVCLDYIEQVWTDMRPLSLRQAMASG